MLPYRPVKSLTAVRPCAEAGSQQNGGSVASAHRGALQVTIQGVVDGGKLSSYPKYVTVRRNQEDVGKTGKSFDCVFDKELPQMDSVSAGDVLEVCLCKPSLLSNL